MKQITLKELLDFGIPRACYCRTNINHVVKENEIHGFIITGLTNACTKKILNQFVEYFGKQTVLNALDEYKNEINNKFYIDVTQEINENNKSIDIREKDVKVARRGGLTFIEDDDIELDIPTRYYKVTDTRIED